MMNIITRSKKQMVAIGVVGVMLITPILRHNIVSEGSITVKNYSVVTSLIRDVKDGSFQTKDLIVGNIYDRTTELYNDIVYK